MNLCSDNILCKVETSTVRIIWQTNINGACVWDCGRRLWCSVRVECRTVLDNSRLVLKYFVSCARICDVSVVGVVRPMRSLVQDCGGGSRLCDFWDVGCNIVREFALNDRVSYLLLDMWSADDGRVFCTCCRLHHFWRHWGTDRPGWHHPGGDTQIKLYFCGWI